MAIVRRFPPGLVDCLHIREKHRSARELTHWYRSLKPLLQRTALLINDRLDAALAVEADGVQLGGGSLTPAEARRLLPPGTRIGVSVHAPSEAAEAARQGADFVMFGHVYATASKPGLAPRGLHELKAAVQASAVPVIALGGITPERIGECLAAGASGAAVLSSVFLHPQPEEQIIALRHALDRMK